MKRPEISLQNHPEVYEFYRSHRQGQRAARFLHGALGLAFRARIGFTDGAEDRLRSLFDSGRTVVLASNHVRAIDPCVIAGLPTHHDTLNPLVGSAFIPAKPSIFKYGVVRRLVDGLGAVPVWRENDAKTEQDARLIKSASTALLATCVAKMDAGEHMAIFPEGTRNKTDPARLQELKGGVGIMICRVSKVEQPAIVPVGISYGEAKLGALTPSVWIGMPSDEPFAKPRQVMQWLPDQMQAAVTNATMGFDIQPTSA
jgi:1-acyl-sn-glycerol-3-phosphate acyltransferase